MGNSKDVGNTRPGKHTNITMDRSTSLNGKIVENQGFRLGHGFNSFFCMFTRPGSGIRILENPSPIFTLQTMAPWHHEGIRCQLANFRWVFKLWDLQHLKKNCGSVEKFHIIGTILGGVSY